MPPKTSLPQSEYERDFVRNCSLGFCSCEEMRRTPRFVIQTMRTNPRSCGERWPTGCDQVSITGGEPDSADSPSPQMPHPEFWGKRAATLAQEALASANTFICYGKRNHRHIILFFNANS